MSKKSTKPEQTKAELLAEIRELKQSYAAADNERRDAEESLELRLQDLQALRTERDANVRANQQAAQLVKVALHAVASMARMYRIDAANELGNGQRQ